MLVVGSIVIRVDDLDAQIQFWTHALDYLPREPVDVDFALLRPRAGHGPNVSLDAHSSERVLPPRIHLDLYADQQVIPPVVLGMLETAPPTYDDGQMQIYETFLPVPLPLRKPTDADYVIMEDPEGNRFCVIDASAWPGWHDRSVD